MDIKSYIPAMGWLSSYGKVQFKSDLFAGLTVGIMLIPQGMAYAMIAGLPPIYGLYAATIPLVIYALLGTSRQLAVGPVAMVSLLTAAGISGLATNESHYLLLAFTLALMVGAIQFLLGLFRLGFLVNFLSHPVISGFTSAAALIIGLSQLKHLLGIPIENSHHIHEIIGQAIGKIETIHWLTLGIGVIGIFSLKMLKKWTPAIPAHLVVVVLGILMVWGFNLNDNGVKIVGAIPYGLPSLTMPDFSIATLGALLPTALAIALVSFMESIAVAKAIQAKHQDYEVKPNQELLALGLANIGGAFFQSYPVTGGFSRTAVNDEAGAKTGMAGLISAGLIMLTLLFLTPLFYYLPNALLAAIIMVAVFGLIDIKMAIHLWQTYRPDFWMLLATFLGTLTLGIEAGIGLGVFLSLAMIIYKTTQPHIAVLGRIPNTKFYRNIHRFDNLEVLQEVLIIRFDGPLYFANTNYFQAQLAELVAQKGKTLKAIIIQFDSINQLDFSAAHALETLVADYQKQGIKILCTGVKGPIRDIMKRTHLMDKIGDSNFFISTQAAINFLEGSKNGADVEMKNYVLQVSN